MSKPETVTLLCIADAVNPLVYTNSIRERFKHINIILSAGDLNLDYYGFIVSSLNKPLYFVFGNHNLKRYRFFRRGVNSLYTHTSEQFQSIGGSYIGGRVVTDGKSSLLVAGLGGTRRYNGGANQYSEFEMLLNIAQLFPRLLWNRIIHGRFLDILLTHAPPRLINDREDPCHKGFKVFRWFLRRFKPLCQIHGHIHLYDLNAPRVTKYHQTTVINVYGYYILELEKINGFFRLAGS